MKTGKIPSGSPKVQRQRIRRIKKQVEDFLKKEVIPSWIPVPKIDDLVVNGDASDRRRSPKNRLKCFCRKCQRTQPTVVGKVKKVEVEKVGDHGLGSFSVTTGIVCASCKSSDIELRGLIILGSIYI